MTEMTPERRLAAMPYPDRVNVAVRLVGGPRDGWVYAVPLHWELTEDKKDVQWVPPRRIATPIGNYLPTGEREADAYLYRWDDNEPHEHEWLPISDYGDRCECGDERFVFPVEPTS